MEKSNLPLTFGPVNSRRFGISLGIDLSPSHKQCNFDCLYCELAPASTTTSQTISYNVQDYIKAVTVALEKNPEIEVITITANGEPTLYPYLDHLVDKLNEIKQDKKLLILSNAALTDAKDVTSIDISAVRLDRAIATAPASFASRTTHFPIPLDPPVTATIFPLRALSGKIRSVWRIWS